MMTRLIGTLAAMIMAGCGGTSPQGNTQQPPAGITSGSGSPSTTGGSSADGSGTPASGGGTQGGGVNDGSGTPSSGGDATTGGGAQAGGGASDGSGTPASGGGTTTGGGTQPAVDRFGLTMIYPSKPGGPSWTMPADPNNDPQSVQGGYPPKFTANADGSFKVKMPEVRWQIAQNNGFHENQLVLNQTELASRGYMQDPMDWKNVEVTAYYRINANSTSTQNGESHIEHVMGGARQTSDMTMLNGFPKACEADSYHANLYPITGRAKYERDLMHTPGYSTNDPQLKGATTPFITEKKWVGWKTVKYVRPDGKSVQLESYIDRNGDNHWLKIFDFVDYGQWGPTRGLIGSTCGGGEYTNVTWGGPIIGLRWDNITDMDVKWASVREIVAPQ